MNKVRVCTREAGDGVARVTAQAHGLSTEHSRGSGEAICAC